MANSCFIPHIFHIGCWKYHHNFMDHSVENKVSFFYHSTKFYKKYISLIKKTIYLLGNEISECSKWDLPGWINIFGAMVNAKRPFTRWDKVLCFFVKSFSRKFREIDYTKKVMFFLSKNIFSINYDYCLFSPNALLNLWKESNVEVVLVWIPNVFLKKMTRRPKKKIKKYFCIFLKNHTPMKYIKSLFESKKKETINTDISGLYTSLYLSLYRSRYSFFVAIKNQRNIFIYDEKK